MTDLSQISGLTGSQGETTHEQVSKDAVPKLHSPLAKSSGIKPHWKLCLPLLNLEAGGPGALPQMDMDSMHQAVHCIGGYPRQLPGEGLKDGTTTPGCMPCPWAAQNILASGKPCQSHLMAKPFPSGCTMRHTAMAQNPDTNAMDQSWWWSLGSGDQHGLMTHAGSPVQMMLLALGGLAVHVDMWSLP